MQDLYLVMGNVKSSNIVLANWLIHRFPGALYEIPYLTFGAKSHKFFRKIDVEMSGPMGNLSKN